MYVEINNLTNNAQLLNNAKKIVKEVSREVPSTNLAFSSMSVRTSKNEIKVYQKQTLT